VKGVLANQGLVSRYRGLGKPELSYATVRDFCDSADHLPQLCQFMGDLKDVQRPWAVRAVLGRVAPGATILEIGGGVPLVAGMLAELGYHVVLIDPYDGSGNGPREYDLYIRQYPRVRFIRAYFGAEMIGLKPRSADVVLSVSVLEHIPPAALPAIFAGIRRFLRPGGWSIHCIDSVIAGNHQEFHTGQLRMILAEQAKLADPQAPTDECEYDRLVEELKLDIETFYLSGHGHNLWRNGQPYDAFPFRRVVSIQSCVMFAAANG